jgi:hypothetical protein
MKKFTFSKIDFEFLMSPQATPYCGPLYFSDSLESPISIIANGSFGLVDTGSRKLLVTCRHVWDEFQKFLETNAALKMFICLHGELPIVLNQAPLDYNQTVDVIAFDMKPYLSACNKNKFYRLDQNPARQVTIGDSLFFQGYPGFLRLVAGKKIQFGKVPYATSVDSVDGLRFHSDISKAKHEEEFPSLEKSDRHPGISGSPCFLVRSSNQPMQLVGFVTSFLFNHLDFVHIHCLNSDGTIKTKLS